MAALVIVAATGCTLAPRFESPATRTVDGLTIQAAGDPAMLDVVEREWRELRADLRASPLAPLARCETPLDVYVFASADDYLRWRGDERPSSREWLSWGPDTGGVYVVTGWSPFAALPQESVFQPYYPELDAAGHRELHRAEVRHELFHHLHYEGVRGPRPHWLVEGLAMHASRMDPREHAARVWFERRFDLPWDPWIRDIVEADSVSGRYRYALMIVETIMADDELRPRFAAYVLEGRGAGGMDELLRTLAIPESDLAQRVFDRTRTLAASAAR